jgi:hypothetical protein
MAKTSREHTSWFSQECSIRDFRKVRCCAPPLGLRKRVWAKSSPQDFWHMVIVPGSTFVPNVLWYFGKPFLCLMETLRQRGHNETHTLVALLSRVMVPVRQPGADSGPRRPLPQLRQGMSRRRRAPWHGAVACCQACGFLLSPICGITSPTDFSHSHTVCCTPPRRREGGR